MSVATQLSRIQTDRNTIRTKLVELGLASSSASLDALATAIEGIVKRGAVSISVKEGESYTIPAGYHDGTGVVNGVSGGGNYTLQAKAVTPTKAQQAVSSDEGYYGLSSVTVGAIPDAYQDVSSVTAAAGDVLTGKVFVTAAGEVVAGTMPNNGAVSKVLTGTLVSFTIPKGYHDGTGTVSISLETKTVTPTKAAQEITPTTGTLLSKVTVEAIPDEYVDTSDATATADKILTGSSAYVNGEKVDGTMPDLGGYTKELYVGTYSMETTIMEGYHDGTGVVKVRSTTKTFTPSKSMQKYNGSLASADNYAFLSHAIINPIPDEYQDVTSVDAEAAEVLEGKKIVDAEGTVVTGTMANNGAVALTIDGISATSVEIEAGYTTGGTVSLTGDIEEALAAI